MRVGHKLMSGIGMYVIRFVKVIIYNSKLDFMALFGTRGSGGMRLVGARRSQTTLTLQTD